MSHSGQVLCPDRLVVGRPPEKRCSRAAYIRGRFAKAANLAVPCSFPVIFIRFPVIANFLPCYLKAEKRMKRLQMLRFLPVERSWVAHFSDFSLYFSLFSGKTIQRPVRGALGPQPATFR